MSYLQIRHSSQPVARNSAMKNGNFLKSHLESVKYDRQIPWFLFPYTTHINSVLSPNIWIDQPGCFMPQKPDTICPSKCWEVFTFGSYEGKASDWRSNITRCSGLLQVPICCARKSADSNGQHKGTTSYGIFGAASWLGSGRSTTGPWTGIGLQYRFLGDFRRWCKTRYHSSEIFDWSAVWFRLWR